MDLSSEALPAEAFTDFWARFIRTDFDPERPSDGLNEAQYFFSRFPDFVFPERSRAISLVFRRIDSTVVASRFQDVKILLVSLLASLAPVAPLDHLRVQGLYESIFVLFLNDSDTFEQSVQFLNHFFDRPDIDQVFDDVIFVTVVNFANYSPPAPSLWRFFCKFLTKFGEKIEGMIDFTQMESNGMLPVFTRSLIWTYRNIYQNPPETEHEEVFWQLWDSILPRYLRACRQSPPTPVISLFQSVINEVRLSIYWGLKSAKVSGVFVSDLPLRVLKALYDIDSDELIEFILSQSPCLAFSVCCEALLDLAAESHRQQLSDAVRK
jgi:hypothetical protein